MRGRANLATALKKLSVKGAGAALALSMHTSEATVSRLKSESLEPVCVMLAHAGLKVVPVTAKCFPPEKIDALLTLANEYLATIKSVDQLSWDEVDS